MLVSSLIFFEKQDFLNHGFEYYPDRCRPQTSYNIQWHRLRESSSATRSNLYDNSPYCNSLPKLQRQSTKVPKKNSTLHKGPKQEQSNVLDKDGSVNGLLNPPPNNELNEKSPTTSFDDEKQKKSSSER